MCGAWLNLVQLNLLDKIEPVLLPTFRIAVRIKYNEVSKYKCLVHIRLPGKNIYDFYQTLS